MSGSLKARYVHQLENGIEGYTFPTYPLPAMTKVEELDIEIQPSFTPLGISVYLIPEPVRQNKHGRTEYYLTLEDHKKLVLRIMSMWKDALNETYAIYMSNKCVNQCRKPKDRWTDQNDWILAPQSFARRLRMMARYDIDKDRFIERYVPRKLMDKQRTVRADRQATYNLLELEERADKKDEDNENGKSAGGATDKYGKKVYTAEAPIETQDEEGSPTEGLSLSAMDRQWVTRRVIELQKEVDDTDLTTLQMLAMAELKSRKILEESLRDETSEIKTTAITQVKQIRDILGLKRKPKEQDASKVLAGSLDQLVYLFDSVVESGLWDEWEAVQAEETVKMMLRKADRTFENGRPEVDDMHFRVLLGMSIDEGRKMLKDRGIAPYDPPSERFREVERNLLEVSRRVTN